MKQNALCNRLSIGLVVAINFICYFGYLDHI